MKKTITLLFALFTAVLSAQTVNIQGDPYSGNPYATITAAIAAANSGDVILVTGTHTESISIDKSITIKGTNPATDIIQAAAAPATNGLGTRVIAIGAAAAAALNVTVENLTVRHGNHTLNGGGINVDKVTGLVILNNLVVTNNFTTNNGGAIGVAGSNVNITNCTVQNNSCTLDGGAIVAAPNNASLINSVINIKQSLIDTNTARNGGGIYINGNKTFGDNYKININIENSTVSNNSSTSASSAVGGGAIWSKSAIWTIVAGGDGVTGNVTLSLIHATLYNNSHTTTLTKDGINFTADPVGSKTNFSAYNSIVVTADDVTQKSFINFVNTNTTNIVNCIFGGIESTPPTQIADLTKNNVSGKTATFAGLTGTLSNEGGSTQVIKLNTATTGVDYCTATTGISIPTIDQRGYTRSATYDAGAYELAGTLSIDDEIYKDNIVSVYPNPASEIVTISGLNNVNAIKVYSILGSLVKETNNQNQINVSNLSKGIYMMMIEGDGQKISKRIIIE